MNSASSSSSSSSPKEIPWEKCLWGCHLPEAASVVLLPCLHVLCTDACLDKSSDGIGPDAQAQCRKCVRSFTLSEIKRDVKLEEFFKKKMKLEDVVLQCDNCVRNSPVASYCTQCKENLCAVCTDDHPLLRKKANHQLEMNLEVIKVIQFDKLRNAENQCKQEGHEEKEIKHLCCTCNLQLCDDCIILGHHGAHETVTIEKELSDIHLRNESLKETRKRVNQAIQLLEGKVKSMKDPEWNDIVSGMNTLMTRALEMLKQRRESLLEVGRQKFALKRKQVKDKIEDLRGANKNLEQGFSWLHVLDDLDDIGRINIARLRVKLPQPDTHGCIEQLQKNYDSFVEKGNDPVLDEVVLPQLQLFFSRLGSSSSFQSAGRKVALKSTGGRKLNCRPLGMPHLDQRKSYENHANGLSFTFESASGTTFDETPHFSGAVGPTVVNGNVDLGENTMGSSLSPDQSSNVKIRQTERNRQKKVFKDFIDPDGIAAEESSKAGKRKRMTDSDSQNSPRASNANGNGVKSRKIVAGSSASKKTYTRPSTDFLDAPVASIKRKPDYCSYPLQGWIDPKKHSKCKNDDVKKNICNCKDDTCPCRDNDDCCAVCLQGGKDLLICEFCPRVFHLKCYAPVLQEVPEETDWRCSCCTPKLIMQQKLKDLRDEPGSKEKPLTDANPREFALACHFILQIYKIPEVPTIKFYFPREYLHKFGKAPYHLNFLRKKLCSPEKRSVQPFSSVKEYMLAFQQMFRQAFQIYDVMKGDREHAVNCLKRFHELVKEYYPDHQDLFENITYIES